MVNSKTSRWRNRDSLELEATRPLISQPMLPNSVSMLSSRCISNTKTRSRMVEHRVPISTLRLWKTRRAQPSSASRSTARKLRSNNKRSLRMLAAAARWVARTRVSSPPRRPKRPLTRVEDADSQSSSVYIFHL